MKPRQLAPVTCWLGARCFPSVMSFPIPTWVPLFPILVRNFIFVTYCFLIVLVCTQNTSSISGASLDLDAARAVYNGRKLGIGFAPAPPAPAPQLQTKDQEQITLTFAQIKELIEQGKTENIPNTKVIPNVLSVSALLGRAASP